MEQKVAAFINKGMRQDYSASKAPNEFAFENYNIRITTRGENSALSVTNEKESKNLKLILFGTGTVVELNGITLGYAVLNDSFVLFTKDTSNNVDYIYKVVKQDNVYTAYELYSGNLKFDINNKIETLVSYESEKVQKVYWVDGINVPRVINVAETDGLNYNEGSFDFFPNVNTDITIDINKTYSSASNFPSGVIQYVFTYYNKFGIETAPVYTSPLYYMSFEDRGGKPDEKVNCNFNIKIKNYDNSYDYLRVYSLQRTSLNGDVIGSIVSDFNIKNATNELQCVDNGANQVSVDATSLLFSNSSILIPSTIAQKDNVLFLGDIKTEDNSELFTEIKNKLKDFTEIPGLISFDLRDVEYTNNYSNVYEYSPNLKDSSKDIKTFKSGETYRLAIQLQDKRGIWSQAIWIGDYKNTKQVTHIKDDITGENFYKVPIIKLDNETFKNKLGDLLKDSDYIKYRLMMAEISDLDREIVAQGFVSPTVFNIEERINGSIYGESSWFPRFVNKDYHYQNVNTVITFPGENSAESHVDVDLLKLEINTEGTDTESKNFLDNILQTPIYPLSDPEVDNNTAVIESVYYTFNKVDSNTLNWSIQVNFIKKIGDTYEPFYMTLPNDKYSIPCWSGRSVSSNPIRPEYDNILKSYPLFEVLITLAMQNFDSFKLWDNTNGIINRNLVSFKNVIEEYLHENSLTIKDPSIYNVPPFITLLDFSVYNEISKYGGTKSYYFDNDYSIENINKKGYFIDASLFNFYSPDINKLQKDNDYKLRIVGYTPLKNTISDFSVIVENAENGKPTNFNFNNSVVNQLDGLKSYPLFANEDNTYLLNVWHKGGSIIYQPESDTTSHTLKSKKIANLWYCDNTMYSQSVVQGLTSLWEPEFGISAVELHKEDSTITNINNYNYKGNYSSLLVAEDSDKTFDILSTTSIPNTINPNNIKNYINPDNIIIDKGDIRDSVSIKYNSEEHAVIQLNNKGLTSILPKYSYPKNFTNCLDLTTNTKIESQSRIGFYGLDKAHTYSMQEGNILILTTSIIPSKGEIAVIHCVRDTNLFEEGAPQLHSYDDTFLNGINEMGYLYCTVTGIIKPNDMKNEYVKVVLYIEKNYIMEDAALALYNDHKDKIYIEYKGTDYKPVTAVRLTCKDTNIIIGTGAYLRKKLGKEFQGEAYMSGTYEGNVNSLNLIDEANPYLWVAELYREVPNKFGGTNENAIENNVFIPISEPFNLNEDIIATEGDTYYQRWDCLRVYPTTEEDTNSVIDIVSLPLESYTNLDGRSDVNRKRLDLVNARPTNTNLFNDVYNQNNNFFSGRILDEKFNSSVYSNAYTWSLKKSNNADVDNWTKGLMVNVETLDGSKGKLNKIMLWNDYLISFQDKGIARINYNNQSIISTQQGVPLEIANSGRVNGHTYISTSIGCRNKWSIVESPAGLYFIDSDNKSLNLFNGQLISISNNNGFRDWFSNNITIDDNSISSYDSIHNDYYLTKDKSLCFSEELQSFSSFYDYNFPMFTFNDKFIGIKDSDNKTSLIELFEGNNYKSNYYMTYMVNPEPIIDKTFNIVEYRADVKNFSGDLLTDITFDSMVVENEYQIGTCNPRAVSKYPLFNKAAKKFRIWRISFPRDNSNKRDRIRNPWVKLTLKKDNNSEPFKMEFHDLLVKYFS